MNLVSSNLKPRKHSPYPSTIYEGTRNNPERNMLAALLQRAIADILATAVIERHIQREALQWVLAKPLKNLSQPFTFIWVCQNLDLEPDNLRAAILSHHNSKIPYYLDKRYAQNKPLLERYTTVVHMTHG